MGAHHGSSTVAAVKVHRVRDVHQPPRQAQPPRGVVDLNHPVSLCISGQALKQNLLAVDPVCVREKTFPTSEIIRNFRLSLR